MLQLIALLLLSSTAAAREWLPEFQSLTETEQSIFEGPARLDVEYESDVYSYSRPDAWEYRWLTRPVAMDLNLGSVSATQFLIEDRAKLHVPLTSLLEFRFTYLREGNLERDSQHHVMELIAWPVRWLGLGAYGEPHLYKRDNDTGLAIFLRPHSRHEIRLFNTFVDVTRLRRSDRPDTHVEPHLPYSRGVVGRLWSNPEGDQVGEFFEYAARYETRTHWLFPVEKYLYQYWKAFGSLYGRTRVAPGWFLVGRLQHDRKFESREKSDPSSAITDEAWRTERTFATVRSSRFGLGPRENWELWGGLHFAARTWETDVGPARYRDLIPHLGLGLPGFASAGGEDRWGVELAMSWHRAYGTPSLFYAEEKSSSVDYRMNLTYDFVFAERAELRLQLTFDLDEYGGRKSWQGGNGQFMLRL